MVFYGIYGQQILTPELVRSLQELDTVRFALLLLGGALILASFLGIILWRIVGQVGKQVDNTSKTNIHLGTITSTLTVQSQTLMSIQGFNEKRSGLLMKAAEEARMARESMDKIGATINDSGIRDLKNLITRASDESINQVIQEVQNITQTVDRFIDTIEERDHNMATTIHEHFSLFTATLEGMHEFLSSLREDHKLVVTEFTAKVEEKTGDPQDSTNDVHPTVDSESGVVSGDNANPT